MQTENRVYDIGTNVWSAPLPNLDSPRTLVLAFGAPELIDRPEVAKSLRRQYPTSHVVGCSSSGEIVGQAVRDGSLSVSVLKLERTDLQTALVEVKDAAQSFAAGEHLAKKLKRADLRGIFILSEGLKVNGSELVRGINAVVDDSVVVTGGLAGDGPRFARTWVLANDRQQGGLVVAVGFYGDHIAISHGSQGGWDKFGPERVITRADGNVLYEIDNKPALSLYKEYLGQKAKDLPASGLLFPLALRASSKDEKVLVRTLLAVDEAKQSMTFAGDMPKGYLAQLMKADFERLIGGAHGAADTVNALRPKADSVGDQLCIAISCVGRRLVLGERTDEEIEAVAQVLPAGTKLNGFYSYGEISPYAAGQCDLHNQTMTLTTFSETSTPVPLRITAPRARVVQSAAPVAPAPTPMGLMEVETRTAEQTGRHRPSLTNALGAPLPVAVDTVASGTTAGATVENRVYDIGTNVWSAPLPNLDSPRTLVLAFGAPELIDRPEVAKSLRRQYPTSHVVGCSSSGEIVGQAVRDGSLSVSVLKLERTDLQTALVEVKDAAQSFAAGEHLAKKLKRADLRGIFILSEGLKVNGSELVRGINAVVDDSVVVTGGLAGDGPRFARTWVLANDRQQGGLVVAVGFYGDHIAISHGSQGGWDKFGPERVITRADGNVLYEIDNKPALSLYKEYLGQKAKDLPASGLLFPLALRASSKDEKVLVRTLLAVDEAKQSMTFAGDMPKGYLAQLMKADFERLIGGAHGAADTVNALRPKADSVGDQLCIAISCVGRRLVLGERTDEEIEAVAEVLPAGTKLNGFYSYGEISPYAAGQCDLHNQTMTLTTFSETSTPVPLRNAAPRARVVQSGVVSSVVAQGNAAQANGAPVNGAHANGAQGTTLPPAASEAPRPSAVRGGTPSLTPAAAAAPTRPPRSILDDTMPGRHAQQRVREVLVPAPASQGNAVVAETRKVGDVTVAQISGKLSEAFRGEAFGRRLAGSVVFDLVGVERVTSFGVREWLQMLAVSANTVTQTVLARCSEPVVHQLGMIRQFAGTGRVASFFAPYLCSGCGAQCSALIDCIADSDAMDRAEPPAVMCPRCNASCTFDDDARQYFSVIPRLRALEPDLEEVFASLAPLHTADAVEKTVEGRVTRITVNAALDESVRFSRVLDGIEGEIEIDLGSAPRTTPGGVQNLESALQTLPLEVEHVSVVGAPRAFLERVAQAGTPSRTFIASALLDGTCARCETTRPALVRAKEAKEAMRAGRPVQVACKRCNSVLTFAGQGGLLDLMAQQATAHLSTTTLPAPVTASTFRRLNPVAAISIGVAAVAVIVALGLALRQPSAPAPAAASAGVAPAAAMGTVQAVAANAAATEQPGQGTWMQPSDLPPPWAERPVVIESEAVDIVGRSTAVSAELALVQARIDVLHRLAGITLNQLRPSSTFDFVSARIAKDGHENAEAIAARYLSLVGDIATPERVDAQFKNNGKDGSGGVDAVVRYRLKRSAFDAAVRALGEVGSEGGIVVARIHPLLENSVRTDGSLIVVEASRAALKAGVRTGDVVLSVDDRAVRNPSEYAQTFAEQWRRTPGGSTVRLALEADGVQRRVQIPKPLPPRPAARTSEAKPTE